MVSDWLGWVCRWGVEIDVNICLHLRKHGFQSSAGFMLSMCNTANSKNNDDMDIWWSWSRYPSSRVRGARVILEECTIWPCKQVPCDLCRWSYESCPKIGWLLARMLSKQMHSDVCCALYYHHPPGARILCIQHNADTKRILIAYTQGWCSDSCTKHLKPIGTSGTDKITIFYVRTRFEASALRRSIIIIYILVLW